MPATATVSIPAVGSLVECEGARGWPGTARVIESPFKHREAQPGHVWIKECGLHYIPGGQPFVCEWPLERVRVVEGN